MIIQTSHTNRCDFCNELAGLSSLFSSIYYPELASREILRWHGLAVLPTVGQIHEGYLLIVPVRHSKAIGALEDAELRNLELLIRVVRKVVRYEYGLSPTFFEHGMADGQSGGCGVEHAHLHCVPISLFMSSRIAEDYPLQPISTLDALREATLARASYLFLEEQDGRRFLALVDDLPSQYMRRKISRELGVSNWDWRTANREDRLIRTYDRVRRGIATP